MTLIQIPDDQAEALTAIARAEGLTLEAWLIKLAISSKPQPHNRPFETSRGALAQFGPAPSFEEIEQNRREMFGGFAEDIQVVIAVADTHAAIWHLFDDERLSLSARDFINTAAIARQKIGISSITLAELLYLVEKQRLPINAYLLLRAAIANPEHVFEEIPLTNMVVDAMRSIPRSSVPDLPDRIIAATALQLDVPVMSCDSRIRQSGIQVIW